MAWSSSANYYCETVCDEGLCLHWMPFENSTRMSSVCFVSVLFIFFCINAVQHKPGNILCTQNFNDKYGFALIDLAFAARSEYLHLFRLDKRFGWVFVVLCVVYWQFDDPNGFLVCICIKWTFYYYVYYLGTIQHRLLLFNLVNGIFSTMMTFWRRSVTMQIIKYVCYTNAIYFNG